MASKATENLAQINSELRRTLGLVKDINRNQVRPGETRIERNLEEELKRIRLMTNEPD